MADVRQTEDGATLSEVNVIPLADLSLVLLIILMVISPMIMQSMIKVQASQAAAVKATPNKENEPPLILALNPDGAYLNTIKMASDADLISRLTLALSGRLNKTLLLTADPAVLHGRVVKILDLVKQNGVDKIVMLKKAVPK